MINIALVISSISCLFARFLIFRNTVWTFWNFVQIFVKIALLIFRSTHLRISFTSTFFVSYRIGKTTHSLKIKSRLTMIKLWNKSFFSYCIRGDGWFWEQSLIFPKLPIPFVCFRCILVHAQISVPSSDDITV